MCECHVQCVLQAKHSVGLMWWLLAREVLRLRGAISRDLPWDVMPDLYFYRDPEDVSLCLQFPAYYKWTLAQGTVGGVVCFAYSGCIQW